MEGGEILEARFLYLRNEGEKLGSAKERVEKSIYVEVLEVVSESAVGLEVLGLGSGATSLSHLRTVIFLHSFLSPQAGGNT